MHITFGAILEATVMYIIVRSIIWCLRRIERNVEHETRKLIENHVHGRHGGDYKTCTHDECSDSTIVVLDEIAI